MIELAPGAPATPHTMDRQEVFVALAGRATATVAEREHDVSAGEALIVPAGETFALANPHGEPFRAVVALPVGGRARLADGDAFIPPWAE